MNKQKKNTKKNKHLAYKLKKIAKKKKAYKKYLKQLNIKKNNWKKDFGKFFILTAGDGILPESKKYNINKYE